MSKVFKQSLAAIMIVLMILTSVPLGGFVGIDMNGLDFGVSASASILPASGSCGENVTYIYNSTTKELVISGTGAMTDYRYSSNSAFYNSDIESIVITSGVTTIGWCAFSYCENLTSVTIPNSVTTIGDDAFYGCSSLTSVTIPDSVTTIGERAFYDCSSLTSVTIPDSVTTIGEGAFRSCSSLTSVTIPDSVTTIGDLAFCYCESLTSVTIPDSVTTIRGWSFSGCSSLTSVTIPDSVIAIGEGAFYDCSSLTSVTIPDSVTTIGDDAFYGCSSLTSVTIPDSVTNIGDLAFYDCSSLTSVTIGNSVTTIDNFAFSGCSSLTNVYYNGTEEQWKKISIGSNEELTSATIHYNSGYISSENIKEKLDNVIGVDYTFTYNDNYFSNSSYTYNHDLAIMSNCLAISAMIKANSDSYPTCAESFFEKLRFDNYTPYGYGVSPQYNSIACAIASKNLDNTDETIIAIGVRGAGYDSEWGGNFNIGTKEEHEGFRLAKEGVLGYLSEFIKDNKKDFNSNVKFWISGYSRAAATSNLVAAALDEGANGYDYISSLNYGPEDVYAYTFETPIPTRDKNTKNALYNNIFNIINRIDYVPKVAPETWGYSRYGVDCFLPSPETYGKEYSTLFNKMKAQHKAINGKDYTEKFTFYDAKFSVNTNDILNSGFDVSFVSSNGNVSQSRYLDEFITIFAKYVLKNVETYTNKYQSSIQKLMISALGGGFEEVKIPENTKSEIRSALFEGIKSKIFNMNNSVWRSSLATIISNIEEINLTYTDAYNLLGIVDEALITSIGSYNYVYTLIENASDIMPAHFPEMNFAWLTALDGETIKQSINGKYYRVIKYNCPIDIKLYDENDNLLATICGDNIEISEDCYLSIYIDADGQKCFCLPEDTEYRFEIIGTDEGTMNCSFSEYDFTKGENTETVNYYDVPVKEDTTFVVELDRKEDNDNNESFSDDIVIVNENEEVIDSDEIITEEESTEITVTVISNSENSVAVGGGYYKKGEFAKIETLSNGNEVFVGWYVNDNLLSTESTCRFMPENDCVIIAKWTSYCNIHGHTDSEWIVDKDSTCSAEGSKHIECTVCEEVIKTDAIEKLPHNYSSVVTAPTCTTEGYTTYTCACGDSYVDNITGLADHTDGDGDEFCDYCDEFLGTKEEENNCSHLCHKTGFLGFIWKIINFFQKLFGTNPVCECGMAHY